MKKIGRVLFAIMFMVVGLFGMRNVSAASYDIIYNTDYYEYYMTGGNDKLSMDIVKDKNNATIKAAIDYFYKEASSANRVNVIPFAFTVDDGKTWNSSTDSATMYINIPKSFDLTESDSIYLVRIFTDSDSIIKTQSYRLTEYERMYDLKKYSDIKSLIKNPISYGSAKNADYLSDQFAVLETSNFDKTGTTYYMLITCKGEEETTTTKTTTKPTEPTTTKTTTKPTEPTTTTTIENPKTADVNGQLYIVIGVIAFVGIVSLGAKFVKANK